MSWKLLAAATLVAAGVLETAAFGQPPEGQQATAAPSASVAQAAPAAAPTAASAPQEAVSVPPPPVAAPPCCKLAALMPVELEIVTAASSKTSRQGEQIQIRVAEPVSVDGHVVIPAGTTGFAEVIQVSHRAIGGKPGELTLGLPYLTLGGQRIGLKRLRFGRSGGADRTQEATIAMALIGIAGGLITGGSVDIPSGTRANAVVTTETFIPVQPQSASKE